MNYSSKFYRDLKYGEIGEKIISSYLIDKGYNILNFNKDKDYDIKVEKNGIIKTLEIKTDRYEFFKNKKTNNMFIETECNGKKSGVKATKADYLIYFYPDYEVAYLISINNINELLRFGIRSSFSGDGGKVVGYLFNRFEFGKYFKILNIPKDKIWDLN
jgi:hypothetical protein